MPSEIASIETGGGSYDGIEIVDYYNTGEIKEVNWHGEVTPYCLYYYCYNSKPVTIHFVDYPTLIDTYAMNNAFLVLDNDTLKNVEKANSYAFCVATTTGNDLNQSTLYLPNFTGETTSKANNNARFRNATAYYYGTIVLPKMQVIKDYDFYQAKVANQSIQIGSVGYPLTTCGLRPWGSATGSGTITIYTTGELLDTIKNAAQNSAGANYTFVYKASEATTYNGITYAAGDTMLTV
jgi:hypothetical protein